MQDYAIFTLDADGYIQTWNAAAERLNGYSLDEAIGRHYYLFYPPDEVSAGTSQPALSQRKTVSRTLSTC